MNAAHKIQTRKQSVLVIGLGLTGYSIVRHLASSDVDITVVDSREFPPFFQQVRDNYPEIRIITGNIPFNRISEFDRVISSPGIGLDNQSTAGDLIVGDIELFAQQVNAPVIGITGSNGKSTVTTIVTEMLKAAGLNVKTGGNIGTPALDLLDGTNPDFYVLELSSFQLELTNSLKLASATVLNISEDHMDRYQGIEQYIAAKKRIFNNAECLVVNRGGEDVVDMLAHGETIDKTKSISFGLDEPVRDSDFGVRITEGVRDLVHGQSVLLNADELALQGDQNVENVLSAMALVVQAGVELTVPMIDAVKSYPGLPHRCEVVTEHVGVKWINDSKGTNVGATVAAIRGFKSNVILIAGGKGKGAKFELLADQIIRSVKHTILFGEDAGKIESSLDAKSSRYLARSLEDAVIHALNMASSGDVVLFSPACASFDMFESYEHRGNAFKKLVMERVH
jgi:UDP-N-acetylmuramoylalanine--D-glutamate ligase